MKLPNKPAQIILSNIMNHDFKIYKLFPSIIC